MTSPADPLPIEDAPAPDPAASDEAAWAEVLAGWQEEERHRAYLARFSDLEGLAVAGRHYREVLAARPGDAIATRWRDEVVKRAMVQGLVAMPRAPRAPSAPRALVRAVVFVVALVLGAAAWWVASELGGAMGARP
jgi:hypothetical protein